MGPLHSFEMALTPICTCYIMAGLYACSVPPEARTSSKPQMPKCLPHRCPFSQNACHRCSNTVSELPQISILMTGFPMLAPPDQLHRNRSSCGTSKGVFTCTWFFLYSRVALQSITIILESFTYKKGAPSTGPPSTTIFTCPNAAYRPKCVRSL